MNFPFMMVLWGVAIIAALAGYYVGQRHAQHSVEEGVFNAGVRAQRDVEHAKRSTAVRKGHQDRKVREAARDEELRKAGAFPRPMGVESRFIVPPSGDAA